MDYIYTYDPFVIKRSSGSIKIQSGIRWDYGEIRGGTPIVSFCKKTGRRITFFHSKKSIGKRTVYFAGWIIFDRDLNFIGISAQPLLMGGDSGLEMLPGYELDVVFPGGALDIGDAFILSIGINDLFSGVLEVSKTIIEKFTK
jgi:predicted GH43/DUF377 family glycosyl hydrolase